MKATNRMRGVLGMAATWAIGLSAAATTFFLGGLALGAVPSDVFGVSQVIDIASRALLVGGVAGALFALGLVRTGRHTAFSELTWRKAGMWGFLGGATVPAALLAVLSVGALVPVAIRVVGVLAYGLLGASLGIGILQVSRRASRLALVRGSEVEPRQMPPVL